jgi:hypothetical protein
MLGFSVQWRDFVPETAGWMQLLQPVTTAVVARISRTSNVVVSMQFSQTDPTVSNASTSPGLLTKWIVSAFFAPSVRYDCILCLRIEFEPL